MFNFWGQKHVNGTTHENRVEPFQERHSIDKVEASPRGCANGVDNEVNALCVATDCSIECPLYGDLSVTKVELMSNTYRPNLSIRGELKGDITDGKVQTLQVFILGRRKTKEAGTVIVDTARSGLVPSEGIYTRKYVSEIHNGGMSPSGTRCDQHECGTSVHDTRTGGLNACGGTIMNFLSNSPVPQIQVSTEHNTSLMTCLTRIWMQAK